MRDIARVVLLGGAGSVEAPLRRALAGELPLDVLNNVVLRKKGVSKRWP